jgi:mRNA-degrading endonuclease RelE of RelBE toxin-antitoxin system
MPYRLHVSPEAELSLAALPPQRARDVRIMLLERLEEVARLSALRRYGDEREAEVFRLRVGSFLVGYVVDSSARSVTLCELVRVPSTRVPSVE